MYRIIKSAGNEYIRNLIKLKQKKYREREKKFLVEGYHLVEAGKEFIETILISDRKDLKLFPEKEHILVTSEIIKRLSDTETPPGIIGAARMKKESFLHGDNILILDDIRDPLNAGLLFRSALAFGFKDVILSTESVDVYNGKVIRGSQGAIFGISFRYGSLEKEIISLKEKGYRIFCTSPRSGSLCRESEEEGKSKKNVLVLGNETHGVRKQIMELADACLTVPIKDIESLNVAVAGSILMYEFAKSKKEFTADKKCDTMQLTRE